MTAYQELLRDMQKKEREERAAYFRAVQNTIHSLLNNAATSRARANRHNATLKRGCILPTIVAEMRGQAISDAKEQLRLVAWLRKVSK